MTKEFESVRRNSLKTRFTGWNLLLFLTGASIGCIMICWSGVKLPLAEWVTHCPSSIEFPGIWIRLCIINGKFLLLLYLLSYLRFGAALVPAAFCMEGMLLGSVFGAAFYDLGYLGVTTLGITLMFRLLMLLPYGFLLGTWSMDYSLQFHRQQDDIRSDLTVLLITLAVIAGTAFLECLLGRSLGRMYYLKIGV